jgi:hypothetical protein
VSLTSQYVYEVQEVNVTGFVRGNFVVIVQGSSSAATQIAWNATAATFAYALGSVGDCGSISVSRLAVRVHVGCMYPSLSPPPTCPLPA